jgi:mannose/fructose-specific phosphotransferase system component IIA
VGGGGGSLTALSNEGRSTVDLANDIGSWLDEHPGPVVIMVDVAGGSCASAARLAAAERPGVWVVGGANLPMLVTFVAGVESMEPASLVSKILDRARVGVCLLGEPK